VDGAVPVVDEIAIAVVVIADLGLIATNSDSLVAYR